MNIDISRITKILRKLKKRDPVLFSAVKKKISQIGSSDEISIQHFKNLRHDSSEYKRVHIRSFVLTFRISKDKIIFETLKHHDDAYK